MLISQKSQSGADGPEEPRGTSGLQSVVNEATRVDRLASKQEGIQENAKLLSISILCFHQIVLLIFRVGLPVSNNLIKNIPHMDAQWFNF